MTSIYQLLQFSHYNNAILDVVDCDEDLPLMINTDMNNSTHMNGNINNSDDNYDSTDKSTTNSNSNSNMTTAEEYDRISELLTITNANTNINTFDSTTLTTFTPTNSSATSTSTINTNAHIHPFSYYTTIECCSSKIQCKTQIIAGKYDKIAGYTEVKELSQNIKNSHFYELNTGHLILFEEPIVWRKLIMQFLNT